MATTAKTAIEEKLRDVMLDTPALDSLMVVYRGVEFRVPRTAYPYGQVVITSEETTAEQTGGIKERTYTGSISFHVLEPDKPAPILNRRADVQSYITIEQLVDGLVEALSTPDMATLGDLAFDNGSVTGFTLESPVEYGVAQDERTNNYENFGALPFTARTLERII